MLAAWIGLTTAYSPGQENTPINRCTRRGLWRHLDVMAPTNGQITYMTGQPKSFHVQDGASIKLLQQHGIEIAIISGRKSPAVNRRAEELGIKYVYKAPTARVRLSTNC